jgi:dCTP deaminase
LILPDLEIWTLCKRGLVSPFDEALVNPASLDVRLGENLLIEVEGTSEMESVSLRGTAPEQPFLLQPHQFVLAETVEFFKVPDCIAGQLALKSSRAREGIEHLMAGYVDPGYEGRLTLELQNARSLHPVALWHGMRIGQLVWHKMSMLPAKSYALTGRRHQSTEV